METTRRDESDKPQSNYKISDDSSSTNPTLFDNEKRQAKNLYDLAGEFKSSSSLGTYTTSTSTVTGIGMVAGRVVNRVGQIVTHAVENRMLRSHLRKLRKQLGDNRRPYLLLNPIGLESVLADLLELIKIYSFPGMTIYGYQESIFQDAFKLIDESRRWNLTPRRLPVGSRMILMKYYARLYKMYDDIENAGLVLDRLFELSNHFNLSHRKGELRELVQVHLVPVVCDFLRRFSAEILQGNRQQRLLEQFQAWDFFAEQVLSIDRYEEFLLCAFEAILNRLEMYPYPDLSRHSMAVNFSVFRSLAPLALNNVPLARMLFPLISFKSAKVQPPSSYELLCEMLPVTENSSLVKYILDLYSKNLNTAIRFHWNYHVEITKTLCYLCTVEEARRRLIALKIGDNLWNNLALYEERPLIEETSHVGALAIIEIMELLKIDVDWEHLATIWLIRGGSLSYPDEEFLDNFCFRIFWWGLHLFYEASKERQRLWVILENLKIFPLFAARLDMPVLEWGMRHSAVSHVYIEQVLYLLETQPWIGDEDENSIKEELYKRSLNHAAFSDYLLTLQHRKRKFR